MDEVNRKIKNKRTICSLNGLVKKINKVFIAYFI